MRYRTDYRPRRLLRRLGLPGLTVALAVAGHAPAQGQLPEPARVTTSDVFWVWDPGAIVGSSQLVRNEAGLSAAFHASELPEGQAMTLWFIVFNNPAACASSPCSPDDLFNPEVRGDFLWGAGDVVGGSGHGQFGGHLRVGDTSTSGFAEIGMPERVVGLTDPRNAEVHLALHSHGPAVPGQVLKQQITSFTGGCATFLGGPDGIADGPADVPDAVGECSTIQASVHQ